MKQASIAFGHAFVVWALCGATVAVGRELISMQATLIVHAVGAPLYAALASALYFRRHVHMTPLQTASVFVGVIVALDAGLVAPVFERSYAMFRSVLGTWLPFALIFGATWLTGTLVQRER